MAKLLSIESIFSASGYQIIPVPAFGFLIKNDKEVHTIPGDGCYSHIRLRQFVAEKLGLPDKYIALPITTGNVGDIASHCGKSPTLIDDILSVAALDEDENCFEQHHEGPWGGVFSLDIENSYDEDDFLTIDGYYEFEIPKMQLRDFSAKNTDCLSSVQGKKVTVYSNRQSCVIPSLTYSTLQNIELKMPTTHDECARAAQQPTVSHPKVPQVAVKMSTGEELLAKILGNEVPLTDLKKAMGSATLGMMVKVAPKNRTNILAQLKDFVEDEKSIFEVFEWISQQPSKYIRAYLVQNINTHLALDIESQSIGIKQEIIY